MNLLEAYIAKHKRLVIMLSYTPGLDMSSIIEDLNRDLGFTVLHMEGKALAQLDYNPLNMAVRAAMDENEVDNRASIIDVPLKLIVTAPVFMTDKLTWKSDVHFKLAASAKLASRLTGNDERGSHTGAPPPGEARVTRFINIATENWHDVADKIFEKLMSWLDTRMHGNQAMHTPTEAAVHGEADRSLSDSVDAPALQSSDAPLSDSVDVAPLDMPTKQIAGRGYIVRGQRRLFVIYE